MISTCSTDIRTDKEDHYKEDSNICVITYTWIGSFFSILNGGADFALDSANSKIYYLNGTDINRMDYNGSNVETVMCPSGGGCTHNVLTTPISVAFDEANSKLYVLDSGDGKIYQANDPGNCTPNVFTNHLANVTQLKYVRHVLMYRVSMMLPLLHHGMLIVGIPYSESELLTTSTGGTPYGASRLTDDLETHPLSEEERTLCLTLGRRVAETADRLSGR